ncbi:MAG: FkbM family methyltransferase [Bacteroidia bacterium]|nr:FkbM family methyltransferase [Bacteroidia bacterium]
MNRINYTLFKVIRKVLYSGYFWPVRLREALFLEIKSPKINYIDIGTYDGSFFEIIRKEKKINKAVLIEPQVDLYNKLCEKYKENQNVLIFNELLGNKKQVSEFYINNLKATSSIFKFNDDIVGKDLDKTCIEKEKRKTNLLDELVPPDMKKIDLLKVDVQGAELLVLQGAEETLKKTIALWIEVSFKKIYEESVLFSEIKLWLENRGFFMKEIHPGFRAINGELLQADCLFKKIEK